MGNHAPPPAGPAHVHPLLSSDSTMPWPPCPGPPSCRSPASRPAPSSPPPLPPSPPRVGGRSSSVAPAPQWPRGGWRWRRRKSTLESASKRARVEEVVELLAGLEVEVLAA